MIAVSYFYLWIWTVGRVAVITSVFGADRLFLYRDSLGQRLTFGIVHHLISFCLCLFLLSCLCLFIPRAALSSFPRPQACILC